MNVFLGKGMYLWVANRVEGGREDRPVVEAEKIAAATAAAGMTHVLTKVTNGMLRYNQWGTYLDADGKTQITWTKSGPTAVDHVAPVVAALRARGVEPWGWGYSYGINPAGEVMAILAAIRDYKLAGFVVNAEKEWKGRTNKQAREFMTALRNGVGPDFPLGFSSYKYPSLHAELPFAAFLDLCQVAMPQVYWISKLKAQAPVAELERSLREYGALAPHCQLVPTGAAYGEQGWAATSEQVYVFLEECERVGVEAVNFWEYRDARHRYPGHWRVISEYPWPGSVEAPPAGEGDPSRRGSGWWQRLVGRLRPRPI